MKIVISLGGSVLTEKLTANNFRRYANILLKLERKGHKIIVVCGAGRLKKYIEIAKDLKASNYWRDMVGISSTHTIALLLFAALENKGLYISWKTENQAVEEVRRDFGKGILVCAGYEPGHSKDYDAALFAQIVDADLLINATDTDGVYSDDPKKNPKLKKIDHLTHKEFLKIVKKNNQTPGEYKFFDQRAAELINKYNIKTICVNANMTKNILLAVEGKKIGTTISD